MINVEWEDPGPDPPVGKGRCRHEWFAALKDRPGMWAVYGRDMHQRSMYNVRHRVEPQGYEVKWRRAAGSVSLFGTIYVRWVDRSEG